MLGQLLALLVDVRLGLASAVHELLLNLRLIRLISAYGRHRARPLLRMLALARNLVLRAVHLVVLLEISGRALRVVVFSDNYIIGAASRLAMIDTGPLNGTLLLRRWNVLVMILLVAADHVLQVRVRVGHPVGEERLTVAIVVRLLSFGVARGPPALLRWSDHPELLGRVHMLDHVGLGSAHIHDLIIAEVAPVDFIGGQDLLVHAVTPRRNSPCNVI